jgi:membrane dipeptidase
MKLRTSLVTTLVSLCVVSIGCGQAETPPEIDHMRLADRAQRLARDTLIIDTHIDLPYRLHETMEDVSKETEGGHFDAARARRGGLDAAFMSIYVPASLQEEGGARELADELIDMVEGLEARSPDTFAVAHSVADVHVLFERGVIAFPMGIENGAAIEDRLDALEHFFDRGVRYITLAHSEPNLICDSSYQPERRWNGLSPFGREVVAEMNRLGMMVDVSHVTDDTFDQVLEISRAPVIASHSSCRAFTPGFERNMSDEMIERLAENGGVIQIAFAPGFLTEAAQQQSTALFAMMRQFMAENDVEFGSPEFGRQIARFYEENPKVETTVSDVADHIEHVVHLVGIDHVGIGSDFDGITSGPTGLEDVSTYPKLIEELLRRGFTDEDIRRICSENLLRVWSDVERVASELQSS